MRELTYNGINLKTYGIRVSGDGEWKKPAPDITRTQVPGRSGDLIVFNNRYENVDISYTLSIVSNFDSNFAQAVGMLLSSPGYKKLTDSTHPGVYRMALVETGISPAMSPSGKNGEFEVVFNCKPQIYLDSGDTEQTFTASGTITNPTAFRSLPLIRVYGNGTLSAGGASITVTGNTSNYIDIDCDIQDAYRGATNCNDKITLNSGKFPEISSGTSAVTISGGITSVKITPRWWRL